MRMVSRHLRGRGISDPRVLDAFARVPRHAFVPAVSARDAYGDFPIPIGHGQTVSQPYIVALMVELAAISGGDRVLEIGTGSGYQTAILAQLTNEVYSIEIVPALLGRARETLASIGCEGCHLREGDGAEGWGEFAPFKAIVVSAAPAQVPVELLRQLDEGGRLVIPVGAAHETQHLMRLTKRSGEILSERISAVRFVPFV